MYDFGSLKGSVNKREEDLLVKFSKMKRRKSLHFLQNVIVMVVCKAVYLKKGSLFSFLCFICNAEKTLLLYQCCQL